MSELLTTVLDEIVCHPTQPEIFKLRKKGNENDRINALQFLYDLSGVRQDEGIDVLELSLLQTLLNIMGIEQKATVRNTHEIIQTITTEYYNGTNDEIEKLSAKNKKEFYKHFKADSVKNDNTYIVTEDGQIKPFIDESQKGNITISNTSVGLGTASAALLKILPTILNAQNVFGVIARNVTQRNVLSGFRRPFVVTALGAYSIFKGYKYFKGRKAKKIASITMALVLKHQEIEQKNIKNKFMNYITDLMETGEKLKKDLCIANVEVIEK
jgi:hypothetical protein